jgi:hypothetical protein
MCRLSVPYWRTFGALQPLCYASYKPSHKLEWITAGELSYENCHVTSDRGDGMKVMDLGQPGMRASEKVNADQEAGQGNSLIGISG